MLTSKSTKKPTIVAPAVMVNKNAALDTVTKTPSQMILVENLYNMLINS